MSQLLHSFLLDNLYSRGVKLIFTEGHISMMVTLKGPVVTVWFPPKGQL